MRHLRSAISILIVGLAGCITFPPPLIPIDGVHSDPVGSTAAHGYVGGVFLPGPNAGGGGAHVNHQFTDNMSASVDGASFGNSGSVYVAERLGGRYTLDNQKVAFTLGVGSETLIGSGPDYSWGHNSETAITGDAGLRAGTLLWNLVEPYAALSVAGVSPTWKEAPGAYLVADVGASFHVTERWRLGADLGGVPASFGFGVIPRLGLETIVALVPTVSCGYVFGG